jgi:hypothetical protein
VLVPLGVVMVTSTVPAAPDGAVTVTEVADEAVMAARALPNFTALAAPRLVPVMVTEVPPTRGPAAGAMAVTAGAGS